jgi:branched-chain amino acid transport system permease protein
MACWPAAIGSASTWLTLTVAGLAMGLIIFIIASGLTLVFGLMDVLNFGHGVFIALGAFVATSVMGGMAGLPGRPAGRPGGHLLRHGWWPWRWPARWAGLRARDRAAGLRPAPEADPHHDGRHDRRRGDHQGHLGPAADPAAAARGRCAAPSLFGDAAIEKYRVLAVGIGLLVFAALLWVLNRTKVGLLIRAGVQDREMVESRWATASAPVRRRVRRRLGAGRAGRRDVGPVPAERDAADRRAGQRADLHRHHHRRPGLARWAASSARCWWG